MTEPSQVLARLVGRGVRLEVRGDKLRFEPRSAVDDELERELRRHKAALIECLRAAEPRNGHTPSNGVNGRTNNVSRIGDGPVVTSPSGKARVSVVITCHDYGRYLESAILSVLGQTWPVDEIVVVDDASSDNTREVAERFSRQGVRYVRVENRSAHLSRRDGFRRTKGNFVLFLDADNYLLPEHVETGLREFDDRHVGVVYSDLQQFGLKSSLSRFPAYSRHALMRQNFVDANAIVRREALEVSSAFDVPLDGVRTPEDYVMFQRLACEGWDFRKQPTPVQYRTHDRQKSVLSNHERARGGYFARTGLEHQDVTLFIPLSGRESAWREQSEFLERQSWPHDQIRLVLCDTSRSPTFSRAVREWIAASDYADVRHFAFAPAPPGLADEDRRDRSVEVAVQLAMCRIYNRLRSALETDYCWILEDDVIPPDDVLRRLLHHFAPDVGCVTAPYPSRWDPDYVVWTIDRRRPEGSTRQGTIRASKPKPSEPQVTEVRGSGFGCVVMRAELLDKHLFTLPPGEPHYDPYFFRLIGDHWRRLCDWTCECEHLGVERPV